MQDELRIVLHPNDALQVDMQDQETMQLRLNNPVTFTGTTNYNELGNKPQINSVTLQGNKSASDLGLVNKSGDNMTGTLRAENYVTRWGLEFQNSSEAIVGGVYQDMWNDNNQVYINEFTSENKKECYLLPSPTASADSYFDILTSKNAVTVAQGGTGAATAAAAAENLGVVKIAGDTMTGTLNVPHMRVYDTPYPMYAFVSQSSDTTALGAVFEDLNLRRMAIRQRSTVGYTEDYFLPTNEATSANAQYLILTTKNPVTAFKDMTISITSLASGAWTQQSITQFTTPTGYVRTGISVVGGSTTDIRSYLYVLTNGNANWVLLYNASGSAMSGTATLRAHYILQSQSKEFTQ